MTVFFLCHPGITNKKIDSHVNRHVLKLSLEKVPVIFLSADHLRRAHKKYIENKVISGNNLAWTVAAFEQAIRGTFSRNVNGP